MNIQWNWIADNSDTAASIVTTGPQPTCANCAFVTVMACQAVVVVKL